MAQEWTMPTIPAHNAGLWSQTDICIHIFEADDDLDIFRHFDMDEKGTRSR